MKWIEVAPGDKSATAFVLYNKELMQAQNPQVSVGHPSIILSTKDIQGSYDGMREKGVRTGEISRMPHGSMFQFYDMDGNVYLLREDQS